MPEPLDRFDRGKLEQHEAPTIVLALKQDSAPKLSRAERGDKIFSRDRARWRDTYDQLMKKLGKFGADVRTSPTDSYISLLRKGKKFAIVAVTAERLDLGIKRKGAPVGGRFESAGSWNAMVTHRARITDPGQLDAEIYDWLEQAYAAAQPVKTTAAG